MLASVLWKRLDSPGHDACSLGETEAGWQIDGAATFLHEGVPARLDYRVTCDPSWRTRQGWVRGWLGLQAVEFNVGRTAEGVWTLNDGIVPGLTDCVDVDLGFTPATNLLQLRRLALAEGRAADCPVAWLDVAAGSLDLLVQRYERRTDTTYWYEAPRFEYAALLEVDPVGAVRRYPGLWELEADLEPPASS
jgi:uncharacterized protein